MKMQSKAKLRYLRIAPRKVRLVVDLIRGMKVEKAIEQLQFSGKNAARPVLKLLESCVANSSHNHNMDTKSLVVKTAFVDEGPTMYRWMPKAMGRATPIRKRTSHITLVLEGEARQTAGKKSKKEIVEEKATIVEEETKKIVSEKKKISKNKTKK